MTCIDFNFTFATVFFLLLLLLFIFVHDKNPIGQTRFGHDLFCTLFVVIVCVAGGGGGGGGGVYCCWCVPISFVFLLLLHCICMFV